MLKPTRHPDRYCCLRFSLSFLKFCELNVDITERKRKNLSEALRQGEFILSETGVKTPKIPGISATDIAGSLA
jgi:hypothetical protein